MCTSMKTRFACSKGVKKSITNLYKQLNVICGLMHFCSLNLDFYSHSLYFKYIYPNLNCNACPVFKRPS